MGLISSRNKIIRLKLISTASFFIVHDYREQCKKIVKAVELKASEFLWFWPIVGTVCLRAEIAIKISEFFLLLLCMFHCCNYQSFLHVSILLPSFHENILKLWLT